MASYHYYYVLKIITLGQLGEAVPDEQILLWEKQVSPERSQGPFRSIVGKAIPEVILEEIQECDSGTFCWGAPTPPPEQ